VVVVGIAVAVIVALGSSGHGDEQAATTASASPSASPSATSSTTPSAGAADALGVPVQHWNVGPVMALPEGVVVVVEHGCTQCDGPTSSLARVVGGTGSDSGPKTLFPPAGLDTGYIDAFAISPDGGELYVTVCSRGYCGGVGEVSPDAQTTVYHSVDGGVTWQAESSYGPPSSVSLGSDGWVLTTQQFDGTQYSYSSEVYPNAITAPQATIPMVPPELTAALAGRFDQQTGILPVSVTPDGDTIVEWLETAGEQRTWFIGRWHDGALQSVITTVGSITIGGWISDTVAVGNYFVPAGPGAGAALFARPALLDFAAGKVTPLTIGNGQPSNPSAPDRDRIVNVQYGSFAEVHTGGDCLNVREEASTSSKSLGCFADGVLLQLSDVVSVMDDGTTWQSVVTPSGAAGWASAEFLVK